MGLPLALYDHGRGYNDLRVPLHDQSNELAVRAEAWLRQNKIEMGGAAVRAHATTLPGGDINCVLQPPLDENTAKGLLEHLVNQNEHPQYGIANLVNDRPGTPREDRIVATITPDRFTRQPVAAPDLNELGAGALNGYHDEAEW